MTEYEFRNGIVYCCDVLEGLRQTASCSIQCVVTSPPFWGLRDYGVAGQIGLEPTVDLYVAKMVEVFREVRRVLRDDGVLWFNLGDSYASGPKNRTLEQAAANSTLDGTRSRIIKQQSKITGDLKEKDLCGVPWRVALVLQADGWWLRQDVIWEKPSPMPTSVSDRCTTSHEYIFLLTKSKNYYFDQIAIAEPCVSGNNGSSFTKGKTAEQKNNLGQGERANPTTRNKRSIWRMGHGGGFKKAHFATFPKELPLTCIKASTSEHGCCAECFAPYERIVESIRVPTRPGTNSKVNNHNQASDDPDSPYHNQNGSVVGNRDPERHVTEKRTIGWKKTCHCQTDEITQSKVLDPFAGSGTTLQAAMELGQKFVGIELNPDYITFIQSRLQQPTLY